MEVAPFSAGTEPGRTRLWPLVGIMGAGWVRGAKNLGL